MKKTIWLYVIFAGILFLYACSEGGKTDGGQASKVEEESTDLKDYIGEQIDIAEDGSIQLPFHSSIGC